MQARLIADYVQGARDLNGAPRYDKVAIYHPEAAGDLYVTTLVEDMRKNSPNAGWRRRV